MMDFQQKGVYMPLLVSRREFLAGMGAMGAATVVVSPSCYALAESASSFRVSIINDEISQDFGHACEVASREFGMRWIELRTMWNKNIVNLDSKEVVLCSKWIGRALHDRDTAKLSTFMRALRSISRTRCWGGGSKWPKPSVPIACAASISGDWTIRLRTARPSIRNCWMPQTERARRASPCCWRMTAVLIQLRVRKRPKFWKR